MSDLMREETTPESEGLEWGGPLRRGFSQERAQIILDHLKTGATRQSAYRAAHISKEKFLSWCNAVADRHLRYHILDPVTKMTVTIPFGEAVEIAEEYYVTVCQQQLTRAITGIPTEVTTVKKETVIATRTIKDKDGQVITEQYPLEKVTTTTVRSVEVDVGAAKWFLERRRKADYGAGKEIDYDAEISKSIGAILATAAGMGAMAGVAAKEAAGAVERSLTGSRERRDKGNHDLPLRPQRRPDEIPDGPHRVLPAVFEVRPDDGTGGNAPVHLSKPPHRRKSKS